jgi:hypothetical protein
MNVMSASEGAAGISIALRPSPPAKLAIISVVA